VLLSEDFNPEAVLEGVSFANPLDTVDSTSPPWARSSQKGPPKGMEPDGERTGMTGDGHHPIT
jgi:hypothetical protein